MTTGARVVQARAPHALGRALAATVVVVTGALAAHTWAGGMVPTGPGIALVSAVVLAGGLLLCTRDVPVWALLPAVAAAQLGLHESFGLVEGHTQAMPAAGTGPDWTWHMVAAHLFVTLLTAVLWWAGRRAASCVVCLGRRPAATCAPSPALQPAVPASRNAVARASGAAAFTETSSPTAPARAAGVVVGQTCGRFRDSSAEMTAAI